MSDTLWARRQKIISAFVKKRGLNNLIINDIRDIFYYQFSPLQKLSAAQVRTSWQNFITSSDVHGDFVYHVYLHVPFCYKKCTCCNYFSLDSASLKQQFNFFSHLIKELNYFGPLFQDRQIATIFIGGGSPSVLPEKELNILLKTLQTYFASAANTFKTFEANPYDLDEAKLRLLKKYGWQKISLGAQSFDGEVLAGINRQYQNFEQVKSVFNKIDNLGFYETNVDLLVGLKNDTAVKFLTSLEQTISLKPNSITLYRLTPTREYLVKNFNNSLEEFNCFCNELISSIRSELLVLLKKYNYFMEFPLDNLLTAEVTLRKKAVHHDSGQKYEKYNDFTCGHESLLGFGPSARSYIYGVLNYKQLPLIPSGFLPESENYLGNYLELKDEMIRFIVKSIFAAQRINLLEFEKLFSSKLIDNFSEEIKELVDHGKAKLSATDLIFIYNDVSDLFRSAVFFLSDNTLEAVLNNFQAHG